jgi:signal transduction histidine kinase
MSYLRRMNPSELEKARAAIQEALRAAIDSNPADYGLVLRLSSELAGLDPSFVRFSVDAGHISRLGRELVSRQETAVAELVKNAYDADATDVVLRFSNAEVIGGSLEVTDDGSGMTRNDLIQGFMRLSSTLKIHTPTSPRFRRQRAGRKGIGRFAAQRLGQTLRITTQVLSASAAMEVRIDWNEFSGDRELGAIGSSIQEVPKERDQGTTLRIDGLREHWTDTSIKKASRHILDLLQPFPLREGTQATPSETGDPGFSVRFTRLVGGREITIADEQRLLLDHALAVIDGAVDSEGHGSWSVVSRQLRLTENEAIGPTRDSPSEPFSALRNARFRAYYFVVESGSVPSHSAAGIRSALRDHGGIRLYRNGFRVLPYGDKSDDWLGLDESYRQRLLLPPHGNNNFFGFVEVNDPKGERFEETSSREGLLNNEAFAQLSDYVSRAIKAAVIRVSEKRGVKVTASQKAWTPAISTTADKIRSVAQELTDAAQRVAPERGQSPVGDVLPIASALQSMAQGLSDVAAEHEQQTRALLEELGMLRVLASLGLTIGEFTHEIRQYLPAVQADTDYFDQLHSDDPAHHSVAERLRENFGALRTYATYFDQAVADNATRQLKALEIRDVVNTFTATIAPTLKRAGIKMDPVLFEGYRLYTRPMHASEWASILFNFFTNSRKAIRRSGNQGHIALRAGRDGGMVFLEFADNGDGVPPENAERIFNAFFTTASPASRSSPEQDDILGTGLGLKIVHDIVAGYGGNVRLTVPPDGFATCFRVEIPSAEPSEVSDGDY